MVELKGILSYQDRQKLAQIQSKPHYVVLLVPQVTRQQYVMWKAGVIPGGVSGDNLTGLGIVTWAHSQNILVHPVVNMRNHKSWLDLEEFLKNIIVGVKDDNLHCEN